MQNEKAPQCEEQQETVTYDYGVIKPCRLLVTTCKDTYEKFKKQGETEINFASDEKGLYVIGLLQDI